MVSIIADVSPTKCDANLLLILSFHAHSDDLLFQFSGRRVLLLDLV